MSFNRNQIHCKIISGLKDYVKKQNYDILYTFNPIDPPGYMIVKILTIVLYQNVKTDKIEYIEFCVRDDNGRPIDFNGDVLSFTFHPV